MKECLNCQNEFTAKRAAAKFCSVNCRVAYNRKQPQKNKISKLQMGAMYNSMMEAIAKMGQVSSQPKEVWNVPPSTPSTYHSFEYYQKARLECETEDDWMILKDKIQCDQYLSSRQKSLLIN
jgi:hypothetical protein